ncbi:MAG: BTAD domain-containing putative transcriptional regulator, partial [Acidimicrobiia bacterium]
GRLADAADAFAAAIRREAPLLTPAATGMRAMCLAWMGDVDQARQTLALPGGEAAWSAKATFHGYLLGATHVHLAAGEFAEAFTSAQRLGTLAEKMGTHNPAVLPWRMLAAHAGAAAGHIDIARRLADEAVDRARVFGAPAPLAGALRAAARTRSPRAALALLGEAKELASQIPNSLQRCWLELDRAHVLAGFGRREESAEAAGAALALAQESGAASQIAEAAALLAGLDAPHPDAGHVRVRDESLPLARVYTLGSFRVVDRHGHEVRLSGVPSRACRILVGVGRAMHIEELAELLWDEPLSPLQVRARMPNVVGRARTPSAALLCRVGDLVALNPATRIDADEFEAAAKEALASAKEGSRQQLLDASLAATLLYEGDLLPTDPYADWAMLRREQLRRLFLTVSDLAARTAAELGLVDSALDLVEAAIRQDPLDIERYEAAAEVLRGAGRHSAARSMAERAERVRHTLGL